MGSVVPFPIRRAQGETRGVRIPHEAVGQIVILPVVQLVRPEQIPLAPAVPAAREPL